jgi:hypothetical protein
MRQLILNRDLNRLFGGAACVAAAGLMLGLVARPQLRPDLGAPRQEVPFAGARTPPGTDQSASWTAYGGAIPDYVIGTDWRQPPPAYPDDQVLAVDTADEPPLEADVGEARQVAWQEPPRDPPSYPSTSGGTPYEADLPSPPEPPSDDDGAPAA